MGFPVLVPLDYKLIALTVSQANGAACLAGIAAAEDVLGLAHVILSHPLPKSASIRHLQLPRQLVAPAGTVGRLSHPSG